MVEYGGSVSSEHGDGRARTHLNEKLYGEEVWKLFRDLKTTFDPDWLLNPGQICGYDESEDPPARTRGRAATVEMTENLRYDPEYTFDAGFKLSLNWNNENGFQGMVELCHGCGGCRGSQETTGGVMCPTYRASREEITATRGRANMLRQAMSGDLPDEQLFDEEFVHEVLDLCISCKGCARDCPSEVDMAKLKVELFHEYHHRERASLRDRIFANIDLLSKIGSATAPLSNWMPKLPGTNVLVEKLLRIDRDRSLPRFERETLQRWFASRGTNVPPERAERKALLVPDTYTNYSHPAVGKAAVHVLEAANVHVDVFQNSSDSGRPALLKGFVGKARSTARENAAEFSPKVDEGWNLVVVEPSDAVMFQSDYHDLLSESAVRTVSDNTYGVCEYLDTFALDGNLESADPDEHLVYHGHCHQKAVKKDHHAVGILRRAGYTVDPLDSGCCGMAGSFGYEVEHRSMSDAIGQILFDQIDENQIGRAHV